MNSQEMTSYIYETDRLSFRGLCLSDIDGPYFHWFNDQDVCLHNSHGIFPSTRTKLSQYIEMLQKTNNNIVWAIIEKKRNIHVGNIALQGINLSHQTAEFAILLGDKSCWGKGYAAEAGEVLLTHGFKVAGLRRIHCGTSEHNVGMQKLALKLGMVQEGVRRKALFENGEFVDLIEFGILKTEFDFNNI